MANEIKNHAPHATRRTGTGEYSIPLALCSSGSRAKHGFVLTDRPVTCKRCLDMLVGKVGA